MNDQPLLTLRPIGYCRSRYANRYDAPHQPGGFGEYATATIELLPEHNFEQALEDLEGMEKIWLLYWFDRNANWKPKVQVPRGPRQKRGVFATRSPHRPNPIGLTLVDLIEVRGRTLTVGNIDLLDETPILDIKPYLPYSEAFPESKAGWIDKAHAAGRPLFDVRYSELAQEQLAFLEDKGVALRQRIEQVLSHDPSPHPYRRTERLADRSVLAIRSWRLDYVVEEHSVTVLEVRSGYVREQLLQSRVDELHDGAAHKAFAELWG